MKTLALIAFLAPAAALAAPPPLVPSHPAFDKCEWKPFSDPDLGLETLVMNCDYGFRKIDWVRAGDALAIRYSDGDGKPDPLIEVIARNDGETAKDAIVRTFKAHTDAKLAARCVLAPYKGDRPPAGVTRFNFVPDAAYAKELKKTQRDDEIGDPPCGDWGDAPDGIQYFEAPANADARAVLVVRIGQDDPLFDEKRLRVLPK